MKQFDTLDYLKEGNAKQRSAHQLLTKHLIFEQLNKFDPILVGTIPINIDTNESDLDIICYAENLDEFSSIATSIFGKKDHFNREGIIIRNIESVVINFNLDGFKVELFAQNIPTKQQWGYRHMLIEYKLLEEKGEDFRKQVIELKKKGMKTEPAFAQLLGLKGDLYAELLKLEVY